VATLPTWRVDHTRALAAPATPRKRRMRTCSVGAPTMECDMAAVAGLRKPTFPSEPPLSSSSSSPSAEDLFSMLRGGNNGEQSGFTVPHANRPSFASSWCIIPHADKAAVSKPGEDAVFAVENAIGCADGVGAWAHHNVDAGEFSRTMMECASSAALLAQMGYEGPGIDSLLVDSLPALDPAAIMARGLRGAVAAGLQGSATVATATLVPDECPGVSPRGGGMDVNRTVGSLRGAIIGDTVVMVVRDGEVIHRTTPMMHGFNCPRQLGRRSSTHVADAQQFSLEARTGDVVITATDGLLDNLEVDDVLAVLAAHQMTPPIGGRRGGGVFEKSAALTAEEGAALVGQQLAALQPARALARAAAQASPLISPYVRRGMEAGVVDEDEVLAGMHSGPKLDDVAVVVAVVSA
jgi:serine/threonine protein phosphatase PrpC